MFADSAGKRPAYTETGKLPPLPPRRPRMRVTRTMTLGSVLLILTGGIASAGIYLSLDTSVDAVAIAAPVAQGEVITAGDLMVVRVRLEDTMTMVPADHIDRIIGRYATATLLAGTVLTPESVGAKPLPPEGQREVGLTLKSGQYPDDELRPGDNVVLVVLVDNPDDNPPISFPGTVMAISRPGSTATTTGISLTVLVEATDAPWLARYASAGKVALIIESRER